MIIGNIEGNNFLRESANSNRLSAKDLWAAKKVGVGDIRQQEIDVIEN